jgi:hypothetical protein
MISEMRKNFVALVAKDQETDVELINKMERMYGDRIKKLKIMVE